MSETGNNSLFLHMLDILAGNLQYIYVQGTENELQSKDIKHVIIVFILVNEIYVYMGSCVSDLCVHAILCCLSFLLRLYKGQGAFFCPLSLFMGACHNWCVNLTLSVV